MLTVALERSYTLKGDKDGAAWYQSSTGFEIFRFATKARDDGQPTWQWCVGQPSASALYYYYITNNKDETLPPTKGWVVHSSTKKSPAPQLE